MLVKHSCILPVSFSCILHFIHQEILLVLHAWYFFFQPPPPPPPIHIHYYHLIQVTSCLDWISEVASYLAFLLPLPSVFSRIAEWPFLKKSDHIIPLFRILLWPFILLTVKAKVSVKPFMIWPICSYFAFFATLKWWTALLFSNMPDIDPPGDFCMYYFLSLSNFQTFPLMAHVS